MTKTLTRRECLRLGLAAGGALLVGSKLRAGPNSLRGITGIHRMGKTRLTFSALHEPGERLIYQIPFPFQLAPKRAGLFVNLRQGFASSQDYEGGADVILFDHLDGIDPATAVRITRNHREANPFNGGKPAAMVKYPVCGGFVPLGALRADGTPHPHAGTGFGINQARARPDDRPYFPNPENSYQYNELHQFRFDGLNFKVTRTERPRTDQVVPGWIVLHAGLGNAIPDGDDFLFALCAKKFEGDSAKPHSPRLDWIPTGSGISRWRRTADGWRAISFIPVTSHTQYDDWEEPSLIRDVDGSLLFCARGPQSYQQVANVWERFPDYQHDICVWRSRDGGHTWKQIIHARSAIAGPISLNQAADGTPYISSDLFEVPTVPLPGVRLPHDFQGRTVMGGWLRDRLCLWPLTPDRLGLETPLMVCDCPAEFGPPPVGSTWIADHPNAATLQLADGRWHNILGHRFFASGDRDAGQASTAGTGAYLQEVLSAGAPRPSWNFPPA